MRNLADSVSAFYVGGAGLIEAETTEEGYLSVIEASRLAKSGHGDASRRDTMEAGKLTNRIVPPTQSGLVLCTI